jgi:maltose O-acetyltransferase
MNEVVGRALDYLKYMRANLRIRYAIVCGLARLVPVFSAGPIIARLYRWAGFTVAEGCAFMGPVRVLGGAGSSGNLVIGPKVYIANDVVLNIDGRIDIGDSVSIGPFAKIYTATHAVGPASRRMIPTPMSRPVAIGRGTWIGAGVLILPGVTIGDGCIIGAGSVVTSDVPAHSYAEGNPAAVVRALPWRDR